MAKLFANSGNPDQMLYSAASDLGLHCLPVTHFGVFNLKWVYNLFKKMLKIMSKIHACDPVFVICNFLYCYSYKL